MNTQMSDRRGTMSGNGTRTADALSTSSRSGTALNTEGALVIKERPRAWLHIEHHKNSGGGYENTFERQAKRRTNTA